jgi:hypothetical protein
VQSGTSTILDANASNLVHWYDGSLASPSGVDVLSLTIKSGDIPLCAMHVTREGLYGAISSWAPPDPCTHFFENAATGATTGTSCSTDDDCKSVSNEPKCRHSYCEAY